MNLSKLEAVNRILRASNEHPVSTLGQTTINETLVAEQVLDEINKQWQAVGLHCNTDHQDLTPDPDNGFKVVLPDETLQVFGDGPMLYRDLAHIEVNGETLLVDVTPLESEDDNGFPSSTTSFETDASVQVRLTLLKEFENLPIPIQYGIADEAAVQYQMSTQGNLQLNMVLMDRAMKSRALARAYDQRMRPKNQFIHSRSPLGRLGRAVPRAWGGQWGGGWWGSGGDGVADGYGGVWDNKW